MLKSTTIFIDLYIESRQRDYNTAAIDTKAAIANPPTVAAPLLPVEFVTP
jgi:hypothetical protein